MSRADPKNMRAARHGGRHAIAGFLFQVLRSLTLGLRTGISLSGEGCGQTMRLTLEPDDGGDHQLSTANEVIIEQVKLRSGSKRWSSPEVSRTTQALESLAASADMAERIAAAELAGWLPPGHDFGPLQALEKDQERAVAKAARESISRREKEAAGLDHLELMGASTKAQQWVRLQSIFELVDPYVLWRRDDVLSLGPFLKRQPHEFYVEAEQIRKRRESKLENETKRRDSVDW